MRHLAVPRAEQVFIFIFRMLKCQFFLKFVLLRIRRVRKRRPVALEIFPVKPVSGRCAPPIIIELLYEIVQNTEKHNKAIGSRSAEWHAVERFETIGRKVQFRKSPLDRRMQLLPRANRQRRLVETPFQCCSTPPILHRHTQVLLHLVSFPPYHVDRRAIPFGRIRPDQTALDAANLAKRCLADRAVGYDFTVTFHIVVRVVLTIIIPERPSIRKPNKNSACSIPRQLLNGSLHGHPRNRFDFQEPPMTICVQPPVPCDRAHRHYLAHRSRE